MRAEEGMTLVELLIAMVILAIGIAALVAGFSSGIVATRSAHLNSTAGALADTQMELYRQQPFTSLTLGTTSCPPTQPGSDGRAYCVVTTISWTCVIGTMNAGTPPTCTSTPASRPVKLVTIEVHKGSTSASPLTFTENATFDSSTD